MINLNKYFDKNIIEKRKELNIDKSKTEITIDIDDDIYDKLEKISIEKNITIEDLIIDSFHLFILEHIEKPKSIEHTLESAVFLTYTDEILDSNENFLLIDSNNFDKKSVLITNKNDLEKYELLK